jgi:catechol 2,3-dioxygenase-like lactoylglutathione lyase family enzyme
METPNDIHVLFVAGFGPIVRDPAASRKFYSEALGLTFKEDTNGYLYTGGLEGVKHFALWPLVRRLSPALARSNGPAIFPCHKPGSNLT